MERKAQEYKAISLSNNSLARRNNAKIDKVPKMKDGNLKLSSEVPNRWNQVLINVLYNGGAKVVLGALTVAASSIHKFSSSIWINLNNAPKRSTTISGMHIFFVWSMEN